MLIDLHTHSSQSDGTLSIQQLVMAAKLQKIDTIALCDHDTTSGLVEFDKHCRENGITGIAGIEISTKIETGHCHIVGLNIPRNCKPLEEVLIKSRDSRIFRNQEIISKLKGFGFDVSVEELEKYARGEVTCRPHIARLLIDKGYVQSIDEAFERFLKKGAAAYVERFRLEPADAVTLLKRAGATTILAHPGLLGITQEKTETFFIHLKEHGLDAIEVFTPHNTHEQIHFYSELTKKCGLKCSGGSDFHGENKPGHVLGYYRPNLQIPDMVRALLTE